YYSRFDILFYFSLGTRNASYTDETLLRVGPFSNDCLEKAEQLIARMLIEKDKIFNIEEELVGNEGDKPLSEGNLEEGEFAKQAKSMVVETAKKMKAEGVPIEVICKTLNLSEVEFNQ
ncbi:MAG: hypothetical protein FWH22_10965, partial [Fibromonadales bacterium]|nr:hypothetical protein [Fibromonadales bacterium]